MLKYLCNFRMKGSVTLAEFFKTAFDLISGFFMQIIMAFVDLRIADIIDIAVVAFVIYKAIGFFKETRAKILVKGLLLLFVLWVLAQWWNLISIRWLLVKFFDYAIIAVAIIFQPELRNALERVGHGGWGKLSRGRDSAVNVERKKTIDSVCRACTAMQEQKIGALIVFERSTPLGEIIASGTEVDAAVSEELVGNIFFPKSPLHDGGMIIRDGRIVAAGCILPLTSNNELSKELGTRHRAAVGMSEASDSVVVVVSEETGNISICVGGVIKRDYTAITLRDRLYTEILEPDEANEPGFFQKIFKKKKNEKESTEEQE